MIAWIIAIAAWCFAAFLVRRQRQSPRLIGLGLAVASAILLARVEYGAGLVRGHAEANIEGFAGVATNMLRELPAALARGLRGAPMSSSNVSPEQIAAFTNMVDELERESAVADKPAEANR